MTLAVAELEDGRNLHLDARRAGQLIDPADLESCDPNAGELSAAHPQAHKAFGCLGLGRQAGEHGVGVVGLECCSAGFDRRLDPLPLGHDQPFEGHQGEYQQQHAAHGHQHDATSGAHENHPENRFNNDPRQDSRPWVLQQDGHKVDYPNNGPP